MGLLHKAAFYLSLLGYYRVEAVVTVSQFIFNVKYLDISDLVVTVEKCVCESSF